MAEAGSVARSMNSETVWYREERWLRRGRIAWLIVVGIHVLVFIASIAADYAERLSDAREAELGGIAGWELTPQLFAVFGTGIIVLTGVAFFVVGAIIFRRRSDAWLPLFVSFALVVEGTQIGGVIYSLEYVNESFHWLAGTLDAISSVAIVTLFFVFPNGKFVPRWTRWIVLLMFVFVVSDAFVGTADLLDGSPADTLIGLGVIFASMIYAQIYRFRRVSTIEERQQTKWVMFGMVLAVVAICVAITGTVMKPERTGIEILFWFSILNFGMVLIPVTIAFAITRHRLFDIDVLINRALVYSIVTAILGGAYTITVILLQWGMGSITGSSEIAVAGSTLVAAGLFRPVRERVQVRIDRRFYRTRYNAASALSRFTRSVRDEIDLDHLQHTLTDIMSDTLQPSRVSIALVSPDTNRESQSSR